MRPRKVAIRKLLSTKRQPLTEAAELEQARKRVEAYISRTEAAFAEKLAAIRQPEFAGSAMAGKVLRTNQPLAVKTLTKKTAA